MKRVCHICGGILPDNASFCPHCARSVAARQEIRVPYFPWKKVLSWLIAVGAVFLVIMSLWLMLRPRTYDSYGEVTYTDKDGTYQILITFSNDRFASYEAVHTSVELGESYRMPCRLFINHVDSGANAGKIFLQKVESVTAQAVKTAGGFSMVCTEPEYRDFSPDAALVTLVDYSGANGSGEILWTIRMENGDVIRLRQELATELVATHIYHYKDYPMETLEDLTALLEQIEEDTPAEDVVKIYLPPVTYKGQLRLDGRPLNLYGCSDGSGRTVFTDTVQVACDSRNISYFYDISFVGDGSGVGVSTSTRFWAERCSFTGWRTGVLSHGYEWVNVISCRFTENAVGFHFNSSGEYTTHTGFNDNTFERNGTAVLLEQVPAEETLNFEGSHFIGNDVDIDNRCQHPIDITKAIFE